MSAGQAIAVIGAGVVGVACARALQRAGHDVTIYDPEPPGRGCSFGNAGHIAVDHIRPLARLDVLAQVPRMLTDPLGPLAIRWRDAPRLVPWLARFALAARPAQVERGTAALAALLRGVTAAWAEEARGSNLAGLFRAKGALVVYTSEAAFRAAAGERALQRRHGIAVETADGAVRALVTPGGAYPVDIVVLAAGSASGGLGRLLGLTLPLVAERGYHVMLEPEGARFEVPITWGERGFVLTPMDGGIRLAGTVELAAADAPPSWARAELLTRQARKLFPGLTGRELSRWMGLRPTLPDYLPVIGRSPRQRNLYLALGHQHIGLTTATMTARLIGDLVAGRPPAIDIAAFAADRFG